MTTKTRPKKLTLRNLKSLGFEESGSDGHGRISRSYGNGNLEISISQSGGVWFSQDHGGYEISHVPVQNPPKTINQLKTLCRFFGIRLKEKP